MKIAVSGGTGFVGKALVKELTNHNHEVVILTRKSGITDPTGKIKYVQWLSENSNPSKHLQDIDFFVNLAGESINSGRWTDSRKEKILGSRLEAVRELLNIMEQLDKKPKAFINASAIGIYGTSETDIFTEEVKKFGSDFLAETVVKWENEAHKATDLGVRTVFCRFGIILDLNQGALPKMITPYKMYIGGNIGNGRQWMSWIHIEDVVRALLFIINNDQINGPVNFTAPEPVRMKEFGTSLGKALHRPHWLPVPGFALQLLLGEMSTLVLEGQRVLPAKLLEQGFQFKFADLNTAFKNIFVKN